MHLHLPERYRRRNIEGYRGRDIKGYRGREGRGALLLLLSCLGFTCILADNQRVFFEITANATESDEIAKKVYTGFGSISILCLIATIFAHWWLDHLNKLHGKILISCSASTILFGR